MKINSDNIFFKSAVNSKADLALVCFPYAGGGISTYLSWRSLLPDNVQLILVQPPGRSTRFSEKPHRCMDELVDELIHSFHQSVNLPYVFFGHSLGSRVAYELTIRLSDKGLASPLHLVASGSCAPHSIERLEYIHNLPDQEFIARLKKYNGTPSGLLESQDLIDVFSPVLRADFEVSETYAPKGRKVRCPISVLYGCDDSETPENGLRAWSELTRSQFHIHEVDGDHFFLEKNQHDTVGHINKLLGSVLSDLHKKKVVSRYG